MGQDLYQPSPMGRTCFALLFSDIVEEKKEKNMTFLLA
jgi:hypothetical protein